MSKTIPTIPNEALTKIESGVKIHFVAEASMLERGYGWHGFPAQFYLPNGIGNGQPMIRTDVQRAEDGTVEVVKYTQPCGIVDITIFND